MMVDNIVLRFLEYSLLKIMDTLLKEASKNEITIHRITQTKGIMLLTDEEITEMVNLAKKYECELFFICWSKSYL